MFGGLWVQGRGYRVREETRGIDHICEIGEGGVGGFFDAPQRGRMGD